ncbi:MAG TPA: cupin [Noviherbaspirillum sp.]|uniref:cupin n=1 Tax=Noviherbaspirillum sp. TaxID=1926288 RepID=UPI002B4A2486|nr:cupin [Noviherbaspirillum sp.]HJV87222.1 cupin [Noviherbaspirillum sp.]
MSLHHATSGEKIDIRPLGAKLPQTPSTALLRTDELEVMRVVLPKGRSVPEHRIAGEITIQCIEGSVEVQAHDATQVLSAAEMLYLKGNVPYALNALEDSCLLMTILRKPGEEPPQTGI